MFEDIKAFAFDIDGVFTDGGLLAMPDGDLFRVFNAKDSFSVRTAVDMGYPVAFITGGCSRSIVNRAHTLGIRDEDIFMLSRDKLSDLNLFCERHNLRRERVAFMGDDLPDIPAIQAAGLGVCPSDAVAEVRAAADFISPFPGGRGAVRHLVENVLKPRGQWKFEPKAQTAGTYPESILSVIKGTGRFIE